MLAVRTGTRSNISRPARMTPDGCAGLLRQRRCPASGIGEIDICPYQTVRQGMRLEGLCRPQEFFQWTARALPQPFAFASACHFVHILRHALASPPGFRGDQGSGIAHGEGKPGIGKTCSYPNQKRPQNIRLPRLSVAIDGIDAQWAPAKAFAAHGYSAYILLVRRSSATAPGHAYSNIQQSRNAHLVPVCHRRKRKT